LTFIGELLRQIEIGHLLSLRERAHRQPAAEDCPTENFLHTSFLLCGRDATKRLSRRNNNRQNFPKMGGRAQPVLSREASRPIRERGRDGACPSTARYFGDFSGNGKVLNNRLRASFTDAHWRIGVARFCREPMLRQFAKCAIRPHARAAPQQRVSGGGGAIGWTFVAVAAVVVLRVRCIVC
jgi:hypothetical protein